MNGEYLPGLGHSVYGGPDPRGEFLLDMLMQSGLDHPLIELIPPLLERSHELFGKHMNVDFPLALLVQILNLPKNLQGFCFVFQELAAGLRRHSNNTNCKNKYDLVLHMLVFVGPKEPFR